MVNEAPDKMNSPSGKRLDPIVDTDYPGDMPDEIDQWFAGMLSVDDLTSEAKKLLLQIFEGEEQNAGIAQVIRESIARESEQ